jgi:hypothetical protein
MQKIMKNFFQRTSSGTNLEDNLDSFADQLAIELKQVASDSIIAQLKIIERKYLSRILKNSHVPILSITFIPQDRATAIQCDEFMRLHEEVDAQFKENFLKQLIQSEYRTTKNCKALLAKNFSINFQFENISTDQPTNDEEFQISLRGKRIRFSAIVDFAQLRSDDINEYKQEDKIPNTIFQQSFENNSFQNSLVTVSSPQIEIIIEDSQSVRTKIVDLPCMIGRASSSSIESSELKVDIFGTYISRNQLYIFYLDKKVYAFIPDEASLLANVNDHFILQKLSLTLIDSELKSFRFGQTIEGKVEFDDSTSSDDYPKVKIRILKKEKNEHLQTPLPNLKS